MESFVKKAQNFYVLGRIAEKLGMNSESASNYFKSLSAVNDYLLEKINLYASDHTERFKLLKENYPDIYKITDKLFAVYRRTYTNELSEEELKRMKKQIEEVFKNAGVEIPADIKT